MKRWIAFLCVIAVICSFGGCAPSGEMTVRDINGEILVTAGSTASLQEQLHDNDQGSYIRLAVNEAATVLAERFGWDVSRAGDKLLRGGYTVHTVFDPTAHTAVDTAYTDYKTAALPFACAILDNAGGVRAVYSGGGQDHALVRRSPFSTIKPLSVYAPAIENGVIDWSTKLLDAPYKKLPGENGEAKNWPENVSKTYTYKDILLVDCMKQSLNTTAVRCLKQLGVQNSLTFLQDSLGMNLSYEQQKLTAEGEEEVIGNVAMGYLNEGVTPVDLAGYYQIFANGGKYIRPYTVERITDKNGKTVYTYDPEPKQVIRKETAYIVNRLLNAVVSPGGTGKEAVVANTEVIGKTGTGNDDGGNWFVGATPEYRCAVWRGVNKKADVSAAALFAKVMKQMPIHQTTAFDKSSAVQKGIYCGESGLLFSPACKRMQIGYYASDRKPPVCDGKH